MKYLFILLIFILISIIILYFSKKTEYFQENISSQMILTSQKLNFEKILSKKYSSIINLPYQGWNYVIFKLMNQQKLSVYNNPEHIVLDTKDYINYGRSLPFTVLPKGYFCILTSNAKRTEFQCGFDWADKKIGFLDRVEKNLIDVLLYGYRTHAKVSSISIQDLDRLSDLFDNTKENYDAIVLYIVPKSPMATLISQQDLTLLDFDLIDINRLTVSYPKLEKEDMLKTDIFGLNHKIQSKSDVISLITTQLIDVELYKKKIVEETFITSLKMSKEFVDKDFKCLGDESAQSKFLCESPYNFMGEPKSGPNIWDKKCEKNEECPFYKANKNYTNNRGGCNKKDGTCEMPLGVLRISFTKYLDLDPYQPFCYQCKNPKNKNCCEDQERLVELKKKNPNVAYTFLKSADYAFENDTEERMAEKLPTTILLPD